MSRSRVNTPLSSIFTQILFLPQVAHAAHYPCRRSIDNLLSQPSSVQFLAGYQHIIQSETGQTTKSNFYSIIDKDVCPAHRPPSAGASLIILCQPPDPAPCRLASTPPKHQKQPFTEFLPQETPDPSSPQMPAPLLPRPKASLPPRPTFAVSRLPQTPALSWRSQKQNQFLPQDN